MPFPWSGHGTGRSASLPAECFCTSSMQAVGPGAPGGRRAAGAVKRRSARLGTRRWARSIERAADLSSKRFARARKMVLGPRPPAATNDAGGKHEEDLEDTTERATPRRPKRSPNCSAGPPPTKRQLKPTLKQRPRPSPVKQQGATREKKSGACGASGGRRACRSTICTGLKQARRSEAACQSARSRTSRRNAVPWRRDCFVQAP